MIWSLISLSICGVIRFRNLVIMLESKGDVVVYEPSPMKYCRYGFIVICATVSSSENPYLSLISNDPSAIRKLIAGCPVLDLN